MLPCGPKSLDKTRLSVQFKTSHDYLDLKSIFTCLMMVVTPNAFYKAFNTVYDFYGTSKDKSTLVKEIVYILAEPHVKRIMGEQRQRALKTKRERVESTK